MYDADIVDRVEKILVANHVAADYRARMRSSDHDYSSSRRTTALPASATRGLTRKVIAASQNRL